MTTRLTAADFIEGILAVAASRGLRRYSMATNDLDHALGEAYRSLKDGLAERYAIDPRFRVTPHPVHGSSPVVRSVIEEAVSEHLLARRNPTFRFLEATLVVDAGESLAEFLDRLPGDPGLYEDLADTFVAVITRQPVESSGPSA